MNTNQALAVIIIIVLYFIYERYYRYKSKVLMIWFYRPGCGHCQHMEGEWDKFVDSSPSNVETQKINTIENQQMARNFEVYGVPHIVKIVNGKREVFDDYRNADNFLRFAIGV